MKVIFDGFITFFGTNNLQKNEEFYTEKLGLKLYKDQKLCKIYRINENSYIGFCEHMKITNSKKGPMITFLTEKVDEKYESLKKLHVENVEKPKLNEKFNIYHFFVKDPDGYTVEMQKFLD